MRGLTMGFILFSLFLFSILTFAVGLSSDYGMNSEDITSGTVNLSNVESFLETVESDSGDKREAFEEKGVFSIGGSDILTNIFNIAKGLFTMITTPFTFLSQIITNVLFRGSEFGQLVMGVVLGLLVLTIIFAMWRLIKAGD